ncbi:molecular chaperone TorD family protein [Candidatus Bipolaricaulota bacterium]|nr:molecular chaperone TorD family protein [Candidatus Bipolaricaulota bacterium]
MFKEPASNEDKQRKDTQDGTFIDWRKVFYKYAAVGFNSPDESLIEELESGLFFEGLARFSDKASLEVHEDIRKLERSFAQKKPSDYFTALQAEYVSLFVSDLGGPRVHPYESIHVDGTVQGESMRKVADFYSRSGLVKKENFSDMPDHIAVELEFLHKLSKLEGRESLELSYGFLDEHLLKWFPGFADQVRRETDHSFYRVLAKWVNLGLIEDKKFLEGELQDGN